MKKTILIKYGKLEYLQKIVEGSIRFMPSNYYVKMEKIEHKKGQGDCFDGKMIMKANSINLESIDKKESFGCFDRVNIIASFEDVGEMPIFCLAYYEDLDIITCDNKAFFELPKAELDCAKTDFENETHALILFEPEKFINSIIGIEGKKIVGEKVRYFDYNIPSIQMISFLTTGNDNIIKDKKYSMNYDDRYRQLLCKSDYFKHQKEFRFIILNELTNDPIVCKFPFNAKFKIVPIEDLCGRIDITNL